jgi:hypothetical protein
MSLKVLRYLVKYYMECVWESDLDEINICISRPSTADCPPKCGRVQYSQLKA